MTRKEAVNLIRAIGAFLVGVGISLVLTVSVAGGCGTIVGGLYLLHCEVRKR